MGRVVIMGTKAFDESMRAGSREAATCTHGEATDLATGPGNGASSLFLSLLQVAGRWWEGREWILGAIIIRGFSMPHHLKSFLTCVQRSNFGILQLQLWLTNTSYARKYDNVCVSQTCTPHGPDPQRMCPACPAKREYHLGADIA